MRRITLAVMSTLSALVLLFSYRTSLGEGGTAAAQVVSSARVVTPAPATPAPATTTTAGAGPDPGSAGSSTSSETTAPTTAGTRSPSPVTVQGAAEMTRFGAVQVEVTIDGGTITAVTAIDYPNNNGRDQEINARAVPQLQNQVLSAQSARVQGVSGATYTTEGFLASVQSALDTAGFTS